MKSVFDRHITGYVILYPTPYPGYPDRLDSYILNSLEGILMRPVTDCFIIDNSSPSSNSTSKSSEKYI